MNEPNEPNELNVETTFFSIQCTHVRVHVCVSVRVIFKACVGT